MSHDDYYIIKRDAEILLRQVYLLFVQYWKGQTKSRATAKSHLTKISVWINRYEEL